ncbi:hypothetical protein BDN70DRAFT_697194 [Pholiota conissans]|uniref:Uncharacterized protein n=1 Tax=Pholiota conissans TaxID=109636 RepID=A0A9P5Z3A6_9AGAR|nr:hypothetical protein BDN70DRAFT_697194 [Pholiota conissans]
MRSNGSQRALHLLFRSEAWLRRMIMSHRREAYVCAATWPPPPPSLWSYSAFWILLRFSEHFVMLVMGKNYKIFEVSFLPSFNLIFLAVNPDVSSRTYERYSVLRFSLRIACFTFVSAECLVHLITRNLRRYARSRNPKLGLFY